ncbi:hypothetical protein LTR85_004094 [Meristemomyces frigidus]|nr:hypothetical protein LTR85_004094 [Meristemomyces frigidus]
MGDDARVALYAPLQLAPYVSLPSSFGGQTSYYSGTTINGTSTWISTAIVGYTPATVKELTTYRDGPSSIVQINAEASPSPSTNLAASTLSATATAAAGSSSAPSATQTSASSTSTAAAPASTASTSSDALSPGAKAGIGVGVAGGVCLLAAVAFAAYLWGKRQRQRKADDAQHAQNPQLSQSPPMQQGMPYYPSPGEKPPGWQPSYPMGQPFQQAPYYDPNHQSPYMHDVQQQWSGVPSPPLDERSQKNVSLSPRLAPAELPAERGVHEIDSVSGAPSPPTPSPPYADIERHRGSPD